MPWASLGSSTVVWECLVRSLLSQQPVHTWSPQLSFLPGSQGYCRSSLCPYICLGLDSKVHVRGYGLDIAKLLLGFVCIANGLILWLPASTGPTGKKPQAVVKQAQFTLHLYGVLHLSCVRRHSLCCVSTQGRVHPSHRTSQLWATSGYVCKVPCVDNE